MFSQSSIGVRYLLFLLVFNLIAGVLRNEVIIQHINLDFKPIVRISSYISLCSGGLFSFIIMLFAFYITTLLQPLAYKDQIVPYFTYGIQYFALVLMAAEVVKMALVFVLLEDELLVVDTQQIAQQLKQTTWYKFQLVFDWLAIAGGAYVFADRVQDKATGVQTIQGKGLLLLALPPAVLLTIAWWVQF